MQMHLEKERKAASPAEGDVCIEAEESAFAEEEGMRLFYTLLKEAGTTRAELGTPCAWMYSLRIFAVDRAGEVTECLLRDVARTRERGLFLLGAVREAQVTPWSAEEVADELLRIFE